MFFNSEKKKFFWSDFMRIMTHNMECSCYTEPILSLNVFWNLYRCKRKLLLKTLKVLKRTDFSVLKGAQESRKSHERERERERTLISTLFSPISTKKDWKRFSVVISPSRKYLFNYAVHKSIKVILNDCQWSCRSTLDFKWYWCRCVKERMWICSNPSRNEWM